MIHVMSEKARRHVIAELMVKYAGEYSSYAVKLNELSLEFTTRVMLYTVPKTIVWRTAHDRKVCKTPHL